MTTEQNATEDVAVDLAEEVGSEPFWLELRPGVQVQVKPAEGWVWSAASAYAKRRVQEIRQAHDEVEDTGADILTSLDLNDVDALEGYSRRLYAEGLARQVVVDWTGVGEDGMKAAVTKDRVARLIGMHNHAETFLTSYVARMDKVAAEGNGSGASPSGTSATAPTTAQGAKSKTSTARTDAKESTGGGARTSKTG